MDEFLGPEETANRGPGSTGPRIHLDREYGDIGVEALSWKRPTRFTMDRDKMHFKLRKKYEKGEIDRKSFEELGGLIDSYLPEGDT